MFKCFHPITGGRVEEIIRQENRRRPNALPSTAADDKFVKFCDTYQDHIKVTDAYERFSVNWEGEKKAAGGDEEILRAPRRIPLLLRALTKSFYDDLLKAFFAKLVWGVLVVVSVIYFVFKILDFIRLKRLKKATSDDERRALILCAFFFLNMFVLSVGIQQMGIYSNILGSKVKAALTTAIYKKMIVREAYGSKADVVSLVAKDVDKLAEACLSLQFLWSGIFETCMVFGVLLWKMGTNILPGLALMCVYLPLQYWLGLYVAYRKKEMALVSNCRISLMEEILRAIKLIKIYGWEASFFKNVHSIRDDENKIITRIYYIKSVILGLIFSLPPLMCMVIFGTKEARGKIETVLIFTTLTCFNTLRVPFAKLPKSLRDVLDAVSCLERIQNFLFEPDLAVADTRHAMGTNKSQGIVFQNASMSYGHGAKIVLSNINLNIPQGSLVMVAGPVAGGKSNLLKSILGDLTVNQGFCNVSSSKAYVPQTPWTALGSVRDNILFGMPYDETLYRRVLFACALEPDLEIMTDGDMTWIGERGGNLSGGQKQRIALARAAYSRADVYVLDSPLSAVDMYTCQHIFKHCIEDLMIAGGGTVVLATHQTELFSKSDHLIVMKDNKMEYNAKYSFEGIHHLFPNFSGDKEKEVETIEPAASKSTPPTRRVAATKKAADSGLSAKEIITDEPKQRNAYVWYVLQIGLFAFALCTFIHVICQLSRVYSDVWISKWTRRKFAAKGFTSDVFYISIYVLCVHTFLFLAFCRAFGSFWTGQIGANRIHDTAFNAVLRAPMHFFHVTPIGTLLSFFSKDMDVIDDILVDNLCMVQIYLWIFCAASGIVTYNLNLFLAFVGGLGVIFLYIVKVFIKTSVPMKKELGKTQSQVIAHTSETLSGLAVVRAFRMQERFLNENLVFQSKATVASFSVANLALWLAFRVDIIGSGLVLVSCLLAVLSSSIDPADAGLIVSNSFQILLFFSIMSRTMGEVHDNMGSVDIARNMTELEAEHEPSQEVTVVPNWPTRGEIRFDKVVMPYLPGKPPVLKGITFSIREGEKIGVVGRTGAGKSSLIVALYRLAEISAGTIQVDSVDCSKINLHKLRSSMAIIPQEPVMFGGTLRSNLDPFGHHTDEEILDVLHKCLLGDMVESNKEGLLAPVDPMGSNFSLGTQQLICLARAMLNPSRVLLLDEATAALDSDTNNAVQQVLKKHFSDRTIFTIAHRLDTVIDSDRILVMNNGLIAEYDRPEALLNNTESIFYELCRNTGRTQCEALIARANATAATRDVFAFSGGEVCA